MGFKRWSIVAVLTCFGFKVALLNLAWLSTSDSSIKNLPNQVSYIYYLTWRYHVTVQLNLSYIVRFGSYRSHDFVFSYAISLLNLTPQNTYDKLAPTLLIKPATNFLPVDVGSYILYIACMDIFMHENLYIFLITDNFQMYMN